MNDTVREWIEKAEGDYLTASREIEAREKPNFDAVCFHAQQCVEKLMKAALICAGVTPPKVHDLVWLDQSMRSAWQEWSWSVEDLRFLSRAAVSFRYPGESATFEEANESLQIAAGIRKKLLALLASTGEQQS